MTPDDEKPLTPAQARQKLQKALSNCLTGNDPGPIIFQLKRTKSASELYPLKLTVQQRKTLLHLTQMRRSLKNKIEQAGEGTQIVGVTWNELNDLNDEAGQAAVFARHADKNRLMAVQRKVVRFYEEEHAVVFEPSQIDVRMRKVKQ